MSNYGTFDIRHWVGWVEDIKDPQHAGRVAVRVVGKHDIWSNRTTLTADKETGRGLPTSDLPWAQCSYPITFGGTKSATLPSPGVRVGAFVHGISLDGDRYNQLIVLGILPTMYNIDALSINPNQAKFTPMDYLADAVGENTQLPKSGGLGTLSFAQLLDGIHYAESGRGRNTVNYSDHLGDFQLHPSLVAGFIAQERVITVKTDDDIPFVPGELVVWPCDTKLITSLYGDRPDPSTGKPDFHKGIDIRAAEGSPVYSVADGVVTASTENYGIIEIRHNNIGIIARYIHLNRRYVGVGETVKAGQQIGEAGTTGSGGKRGVYTSHLHLDARKIGQVVSDHTMVNAEKWLALYGQTAAHKDGLPQSDVGVVELNPNSNGIMSAADALKEAGITVTDKFMEMCKELNSSGQWGKITDYTSHPDEFWQLYNTLKDNKPFNKFFAMVNLTDILQNHAKGDPVLAAFYYNQGAASTGKNRLKNALGGSLTIPDNMTYTEAAQNIANSIKSAGGSDEFMTYMTNILKDHGGFENIEAGKYGGEKPYGRVIVEGY